MEPSPEAPPARREIIVAEKLEVDLGCGKGRFSMGLAAAFPETHFVGIEQQVGRIDRCQRKARASGLDNIRFVSGEILESLHACFNPGTVDVLHIMFPDPWPKRRHHVRRLISKQFLSAAFRVLKVQGRIRFMTDDRDYFETARPVFLTDKRFREIPWEDGRTYPRTDFQITFESLGRPFYTIAVERYLEIASS